MAVSSVQQYLNMALSLTTSNKSKTDIQFSLPDDLRRYENLKIKQMHTQRLEVAAEGLTPAINEIDRIGDDDSVVLVFASHPISITEINGSAISNTLRTSFFAIGRDRSGSYGPTAIALKYRNNLHSPNYTSDSGGATTAVEVLVVQLDLEA
tara:strand:+ start:3444 stop:3899 length:456 start_codon:yes stop_codon:yes gene_type:complete